MKELLTVRSNFFEAIGEDGRPIPQVELILVLSEPVYSADASGAVVASREVSHVRFGVLASSLGKLSSVLLDLAKQSEELREQKPK